jgi:hypothetical protein
MAGIPPLDPSRRESMKTMRLSPGDTVYITQHAYQNGPDVVNLLAATQGSIATVLSYAEYCEAVRKNLSTPAGVEQLPHVKKWVAEHFPQVKERIDAGTEYPVRFETVAPPSEWELAIWKEGPVSTYVDVNVGGIDTLRIEFLEKIIIL